MSTITTEQAEAIRDYLRDRHIQGWEAERRGLAAEVECLTSELEASARDYNAAVEAHDRRLAENLTLTREIADAREALRALIQSADDAAWKHNTSDMDSAIERARAAAARLEGKE